MKRSLVFLLAIVLIGLSNCKKEEFEPVGTEPDHSSRQDTTATDPADPNNAGQDTTARDPLTKATGFVDPPEDMLNDWIAAQDQEEEADFLFFDGCVNEPAFDLRNHGLVTPVKDQGNCGSCWAFGSIAAFETSYLKRNGLTYPDDKIDVSEQQIVDCVVGSCKNGGWHPLAFQWMKRHNLSEETQYPYQGKTGECKIILPQTHYYAKRWGFVKGAADPFKKFIPDIREIKKAICRHGAVAACIVATSRFENYSGGTHDEDVGALKPVNHVVAIIGWDDNRGAWLIKNSWGSYWGENGYAWVGYRSNKIGKYAAWVDAAGNGYLSIPGVGFEADGAGMALTQIDGDPRPDLVMMAYDDPYGANDFRYKIGFNLNTDGKTATWSQPVGIGGVGHEGEGAGIAFVNLDGNARPEMILMAYDAPEGSNNFRYRIGWNVGQNGKTSTWSSPIPAPSVGHVGHGAGIAVTDLNGNGIPEMVLMAYDAPKGANEFRYLVGYDLNAQGKATSWSGVIREAGMGWYGQGAGLAFADLNGNDRPEMILMAYDAPDGGNTFRYKVGWDINSKGRATSYDPVVEVPGVGREGQGADLAVFERNGARELILMAYDNPPGDNSFRYRIVNLN